MGKTSSTMDGNSRVYNLHQKIIILSVVDPDPNNKLDSYSTTLWIRIRIPNKDPDPH